MTVTPARDDVPAAGLPEGDRNDRLPLHVHHPANRGGLTKVVEAVRQLRGEAHPKVQVKNCDVALAHGTGGSLGTRHGSATLIMERE